MFRASIISWPRVSEARLEIISDRREAGMSEMEKVAREAEEMANFLGSVSEYTSNSMKSSGESRFEIGRPRLSPSLGRSPERRVNESAFLFCVPGRNTIEKLYFESCTAQRACRRFISFFSMKL